MISFGHCPTYLNFLFDSVSQDIDFAISFFRVMFFSVLRLILCFRTLVFCILCLNCGSLKMPLISILRSQSGETQLPTMPGNPLHCSSLKSEDFLNSCHYCTKQFVLLENSVNAWLECTPFRASLYFADCIYWIPVQTRSFCKVRNFNLKLSLKKLRIQFNYIFLL